MIRIPHSAFRIPHSAFRIPHSAFRIPHSAFRIPHSAIRRSWIRAKKIDSLHREERPAYRTRGLTGTKVT
jgi:hypothetical protein